MYIIGLQAVYKFYKIPTFSVLRRHPQGVKNTKEYKYQYIKFGSTMPSILIFKMLKL